MRWRAHATSIGLVLAAAGALAYAWIDRASVTESEKTRRQGTVFVGWRRDELTRIEVEHPNGEHLVFERSADDAGGSDWWARGSKDATGHALPDEKADTDAVEKLATAMEFASVVRKVAPGAADLGLEAPRARGSVAMGALVHHFELGGDAPTPAGAAYLRDGEGHVVVVSRELVAALAQGADTYRGRTIVPYLSVALARLEVKSEGAAFVIERADEVSFKLVPSGLRAARDKLDGVWGALADLRAESFVPDSVADPLVTAPSVTVVMTPRASSSVVGRVRVGGACPGAGHEDEVVVVRDAPTRVSACGPKGATVGLHASEASLVDAHLFAAHDDEVAELRLETLPPGTGPALELARKEVGWRQRAPVDRDLPEDEAVAATALVSAVARAEGADPVKSDAPFEAAGRVTVHRADGGAIEVVDVSAPDASGDVVVRRAFDGARLRVGAAVARKLAPRAVALRGREPWAPRLEGAKVEAIETKCGDVDQRVVLDHDRWILQRPAGFTADNPAVLDVIDAVTRLRVESWAADADDGRFGIGGCWVALTLSGAGAPRVARVDLGREGEGGLYAKASSGPAVMVAPLALRDRARAWLIDQHGLAPSGPVESVILEKDGKRVAIASDAQSDEAAVEALREASVLRADAVAHPGPARADEGLARPSLVATIRGASGTKRVTFGAPAAVPGAAALFARVEGVDATFVIERDRVKGWLARF